MPKDNATNFYDTVQDLQEGDYAEALRKNNEWIAQYFKKSLFWGAIIGGIILFFVLLPTILNQIARTIEASKRIGKAINS